MSIFKFSIKFEDKEIMKAKLNKIEDIDPIIEQLKIKFNGRKDQ